MSGGGVNEAYNKWLRGQVPAHIFEQLVGRNAKPQLSPEEQQRHESIRRAVDNFNRPLRDAYRLGAVFWQAGV